MALTSFAENGFQRNMKTTAVLVDLSAAYDTVWRTGLLTKILQLFPCLTLYKLLNNMSCNRMFTVHLGELQSKVHRLNNGLPQATHSRKFIYADDITLASQYNKFEVTEEILTNDLKLISDYLHKWRLIPNTDKTVVTTFHLNNRLSKYKLQIKFGGKSLEYDPTPKYLGVTLDRQLTYKHHIENTAVKLKTRNNIIHKLAGSSWGAAMPTLRTSALALVYSAAEYASPVWLNSSHCSKIDVQLNHSMRIISGTVKSTPIEWLPVLCNILPPHIRRKKAACREWSKYLSNTSLPLNQDTSNHNLRLKSRKPAYLNTTRLIDNLYDGMDEWRLEWQNSIIDKYSLIRSLDSPVPGQQLARHEWVTLNRLRIGHGRSGEMLHKLKMRDSPGCDCDHPLQFISHIISDCPLRAFNGTVEELHYATDNAVKWIRTLDIQL
ncbi:Uncharacterized protein FWK35_00024114 [Aphis craccivora]|uniref:Reverse transcriptase domain-containing protein n=1 Tax=Aphis craccivora TaxID=307492 RepID=A0A6G0W3M4_APHCR|nr:Uncharacterized protein FWK35_00024114 [Aphis craccivora]